MLSPCIRQVTHALLTRPPLSHEKLGLQQAVPLAHHNSVRLACVKHAASVHPEPGSNSRVLIFFQLPAQVKLGFSFFTASLGLFRSFFSFSEIIPLSLTGTSRLPASPLHRQLRNIFRAALLFICQGAEKS